MFYTGLGKVWRRSARSGTARDTHSGREWSTVVVPDEKRGIDAARERVLAGEAIRAGARSQIIASWQRCALLGLETSVLPDLPEQEVDVEGRLMHAAAPVLDWLGNQLIAEPVSIILTDARARVLRRTAGSSALHSHLDRVHLAPGLPFSEQVAGTNGIGTTLQDRRPRLVVGNEHFADRLHAFACAGTPIRNPLSGEVEGILDLTCFRDDVNSRMLPLVQRAGAAIQQRLLEDAGRREQELLDAFLCAARTNGVSAAAGRTQPGTARTDEVVGLRDLVTLQARAGELLASPEAAPVRVPLEHGRVAILRCRPVTGASGERGVAVLASLEGSPREHSIDVTPPAASASEALTIRVGEGLAAPQRSRAAHPGTGEGGRPAAAAAPSGGTAGSDERLLLIGEPGIGRVALLARQRLELLYEASISIGTTLDVPRTAHELADTAVPRFADFAAVDLPESVLRGDEPAPGRGMPVDLRRVTLSGVRTDSHLYPVGRHIRFAPYAPQARCLTTLEPVLEQDLSNAPGWIAQDVERTEQILDEGITSMYCVPLQARGVVLGVVTLYRVQERGAFAEDDLSLVADLVRRAAVCIDNARRYTREHTVALALQRSLLPRDLPQQCAVDVAHRYLPAQTRVSGDWYDVIPLSGARVALVVGDVVGHGVHAAATMGLLRTAVHNFSALDLPTEELLSQLDDLVVRLSRGDQPGETVQGEGIVGATCLYAVYDPTDGVCTMARAGHPPPALVLPDGSVELMDLPPGPPLGLGGFPFETVDVQLPEGSQLVLYTDGLVEDRRRDVDSGLGRLRDTLTGTGRSPDEICDRVLTSLLPDHTTDDVALLVARTHTLDARHIARWDLPCDPAMVSTVRAAVLDQLDQWGLADLGFSTELVVSELVTNAIRYGGEPIQVRLLRDRTLVCEVSDGSNTSPRLRRARSTDEGGRGLFLVAQLADHWGTRYAARGKVIWTEQPLPAAA
ncbi:SpoIIE family protein phosphatase [Streptomyces meridianus]|uniref:SpoIIE family protein phosphatase n=1 Tax=Streptomyces meridianus TaxID=2938945 RepID=A0ABT0XBC4_9ACTN|nr:SpoIIE family protein phosphatase [Streptomyces meridianus]MCM2579820.1 SpoIIE family protein phosphatase [Streptomyces meridianus]